MIPADAAARLADVVQKAPGRPSVAIRADDGSRWAHDAERVVPAASTIKVAILLAALADGMPWEAPVPLPATRVGGCGPLSLLPSVQQLPAGELAALTHAATTMRRTRCSTGSACQQSRRCSRGPALGIPSCGGG